MDFGIHGGPRDTYSLLSATCVPPLFYMLHVYDLILSNVNPIR